MKKAPFDLEAECNFRGLPPGEVDAACYYEYLRESQGFRDLLARKAQKGNPRIEGWGFGEYYVLAVALLKAGFPKPWNKLKAKSRVGVVAAFTKWKPERMKYHPPIAIKALVAFDMHARSPNGMPNEWNTAEGVGLEPARLVVEKTIEGMRAESGGPFVWEMTEDVMKVTEGVIIKPTSPRMFFGSIAIDESYNETELVAAFKAWCSQRYPKKKGRGGAKGFKDKLNHLAALRVRHREPDRTRRFELIFKATGMKSYNAAAKGGKVTATDDLRAMAASGKSEADAPLALLKKLVNPPDGTPSGTADSVLHRSCDAAVAFFKTLFPAETPLSALTFELRLLDVHGRVIQCREYELQCHATSEAERYIKGDGIAAIVQERRTFGDPKSAGLRTIAVYGDRNALIACRRFDPKTPIAWVHGGPPLFARDRAGQVSSVES